MQSAYYFKVFNVFFLVLMIDTYYNSFSNEIYRSNYHIQRGTKY